MLPDGYGGGLFLSPVPVPPGDPGALSHGAAVYAAAHGEIERNRTALAGAASEAAGVAWTGRGAANFRVVANELTTAYGLTADALARGATALRSYSAALADAQATARRANAAVAAANAAASNLLSAQSDTVQAQSIADDADQASADADTRAVASPHSPTAAADATQARYQAGQARAAADTAAGKLTAASAAYDADRSRAVTLCALATQEAHQAAARAAAEFEAASVDLRRTIAKPAPHPAPSAHHGGVLSDIGSFFGHAGHDLKNWGVDAVNGLASFGNAAIHDPGGLFATLGGLGLTAVSGTGEGLGFALDATGVGAIAGVPLNVVSAAGMAAGVGLTGPESPLACIIVTRSGPAAETPTAALVTW
jgi:hypothetical protein